MQVNFYATFRIVVGGKNISIPLNEGSTLSALIAAVVSQYPALKPQLLDESGSPLPHVHIFVNGRDAHYLPQALETALYNSDTVDIFPPVGGGQGIITVVRELRGIPAGLLRDYMAAVGGQAAADGSVMGTGWQARLVPMPDYVLGSLKIEQVRLEWQGDEQAYKTIWPRLEMRFIRPGG